MGEFKDLIKNLNHLIKKEEINEIKLNNSNYLIK
jgi:hypothetical protein